MSQSLPPVITPNTNMSPQTFPVLSTMTPISGQQATNNIQSSFVQNAMNRNGTNINVIPVVPVSTVASQSSSSPQITMATRPSPRMVATVPVAGSPAPSSPSARSALLNLSSGNTNVPGQITIPTLTPVATTQMSQRDNIAYPTIKIATPNSGLPLKQTVEIMNQEFEVKNYQGIIAKQSIENELVNAGYTPLSKIVVRSDDGDKRTQYIKAINKKGQRVFILIDGNGYTTARTSDLTLIEAHNASIVPYSLKTGAYNCINNDVSGVAFECGPDAVCVLIRGTKDLTPKEANFIYVEQHAPAAAAIDIDGSIMSYPVIRLSEIRANPGLVLINTDMVTRRLRNTAYTAELQDLAMMQQSIGKLNASFIRFNQMRECAAYKLNKTLTQLEQWNEIYMANPPLTDMDKDKYKQLQYNLAQRNEGITTLLRSMEKVAELHNDIDMITKDINEITDYCEKEFANVEYANTE